jgi:hypothetical protein
MRTHTHVPASAIALITGAVLFFAILDSVVKVLTQRYPVPMLVWARYAVQALAIAIWLLPQMGWGLLRTDKVRLHLARAALLPLSSLFFFSSLRYLPLAEATAMNYSTPVLVMILAGLSPRADDAARSRSRSRVLRCSSSYGRDRRVQGPRCSRGAALFYAAFRSRAQARERRLARAAVSIQRSWVPRDITRSAVVPIAMTMRGRRVVLICRRLGLLGAALGL